jgi:hypothetical protein
MDMRGINVQQYVIKQEAYRKKAQLNVYDSVFVNNSVANSKSGQLIMRRKATDATDTFRNVTITDNKALYALYSISTSDPTLVAPPSYNFEGEVIIKNNRYNASTKRSGDVYLDSFDSLSDKTKAIMFNESYPISSTSQIVFYRDTIVNGSYIAYNSWTPAAHDHATERIFTIMDKDRNANYSIYRDVDSLRVAANVTTNYFATIKFDFNKFRTFNYSYFIPLKVNFIIYFNSRRKQLCTIGSDSLKYLILIIKNNSYKLRIFY